MNLENEIQMYMIILERNGKHWTPDEDLRNGSLYSSIINEEGDSTFGDLVGQLIDGKAYFYVLEDGTKG